MTYRTYDCIFYKLWYYTLVQRQISFSAAVANYCVMARTRPRLGCYLMEPEIKYWDLRASECLYA